MVSEQPKAMLLLVHTRGLRLTRESTAHFGFTHAIHCLGRLQGTRAVLL